MLGIKAKYKRLLDEQRETRAINAELRGCVVSLRKEFKVDDHPIWGRVNDLLERAMKF